MLQDTDGQFVGFTAGEDIAFVAENDCIPLEEMHHLVDEAAGLVSISEPSLPRLLSTFPGVRNSGFPWSGF